MGIASELRGPGLLGPHARQEYRALRSGQPLGTWGMWRQGQCLEVKRAGHGDDFGRE